MPKPKVISEIAVRVQAIRVRSCASRVRSAASLVLASGRAAGFPLFCIIEAVALWPQRCCSPCSSSRRERGILPQRLKKPDTNKPALNGTVRNSRSDGRAE